MDELIASFVGVGSACVEVAAEIMEVAVVGEYVPAADENGVTDSDRSFFGSDTSFESPVLCGELCVSAVRCSDSALGQNVTKPPVTWVRAA